MRIGPFGAWEILIILIVVLLIFGPRRLPEMAKGLGQSVRLFRKEMRGLRDEIDGDVANDSRPPASPPDADAAARPLDAGARAAATAPGAPGDEVVRD